MSTRKFQEILTEAVRDISENGFDDLTRLNEWLKRLRFAALADLPSEEEVRNRMQMAMEAVFQRSFTKTAALRYHPGVPRFTIDRIKPQLRTELDRRILASANLIKINRDQAVEKTIQRFSGWATSIPDGGSRVVEKVDVKEHIAKPIRQIKYEERRCTIDQGAKLVSSINAVIAQQTGAIAARWRSHYRQAGYDARPDHAERDSHVYLIRDSWAHKEGLVKPGPAGYADQITQPAEEVFCFPANTLIDLFQDVEKAYRRWYDGRLVTITTSSGRKLGATPNHPVLTKDGWVAIGSLKKGDSVIEIAEKCVKAAILDTDKTFTTISDLFNAIRASGFKEVCRGMEPQFHGDGTEENVDIVSTTGPLGDCLVAPCVKRTNEFIFTLANLLTLAGGMIRQSCFGLFAAAYRVMRFCELQHTVHLKGGVQGTMSGFSGFQSSHDSLARNTERLGKFFRILSGLIAPSKFKRIKRNLLNSALTGPKVDPSLLMPVPDGHGGNAYCFGDVPNGTALATQMVDVVDIDIRPWAGHVYNLQTASGWYVSNRIITHNCRCFYVYLNNLRDLPPDMLTVKGKKLLEETRIKRTEYA